MYMSVVLFFIYNVLQLSVCPKSADIPPPWRCIQKNWNHRHHPDKWPTDGQHRLVMPGSTPLQLAARDSTWYRWMTLDFLQDKQNRMLTSNKSDDSSSINNQLSPLEKKTIPGRAGASWPFQLHFFFAAQMFASIPVCNGNASAPKKVPARLWACCRPTVHHQRCWNGHGQTRHVPGRCSFFRCWKFMGAAQEPWRSAFPCWEAPTVKLHWH